MSNITIYTKSICPYCVKAKLLLDKKGAKYQEISVENNEEALSHMLSISNGLKTVPQIFIGNVHVGGCDNLYKLEEDNALDGILKQSNP
jgi:glutaredoxin 3